MACSGCRKRRQQAGKAPSTPLILGSITGSLTPVLYVRVNAGGILPNFNVGSTAYVRGTGANTAIEAGELTLIVEEVGVPNDSGPLYCVGEGAAEICYETLTQAQLRVSEVGGEVVEKER